MSSGKANARAEAMLSQLEELARGLAITIRYETLKQEGPFAAGGLCRVRGDYLLIMNSKLAAEEKLDVLAKALKRFDLSQVYLKPGVREFIDNFRDVEVPPQGSETE
ncbi:MAG: hypothetical protein EHM45_07670 [Desulfobacteraceae bacterium]|nr:MAG: hypothetical protein EHM45_07670 [Desulfobacteraceae bacterium]